jgi:pyruvate,water dikinase
VRGAQEVIAALRRCWASLYSEPSVSYRRRLKLPEHHVAMGVVIQRMVRARCAGVTFTRSPTTGDRSAIAVEASWGLGSAMVSGEVTPDRYVVNKVSMEILKRTVSTKSVRHVPLPGGGVRAEPVPAAQQSVACLADAELQELARIAKLVERHYGKPQDIEWAIDESGRFPENVYLLQSRPETVWASREAEPIARPRTSAIEHVLARLSGGVPRR